MYLQIFLILWILKIENAIIRKSTIVVIKEPYLIEEFPTVRIGHAFMDWEKYLKDT